MRRLLLAVGALGALAALAACEKSKAPEPAPAPAPAPAPPPVIDAAPRPADAARPGDAAPTPPDAGRKLLAEPPELVGKPCFPREFTADFSMVRVIDTALRICMTTEVDETSEIEHCVDFDVATGKARAAGPMMNELVSGASADGKYVVDIQDPTHLVVSTTDTARAHVATIATPATGEIEDARFVDNTIYISVAEATEPRATGYLYKPTGEKLAALPDDANVLAGVPRSYAPNRWAVPTLGGDGLVRFDSTTGAILPAPSVTPTAFSLCDSCTWHKNEPSAISLLDATGHGGGLVEVSDDGRIKWIDGASGKITKTLPLPLCK